MGMELLNLIGKQLDHKRVESSVWDWKDDPINKIASMMSKYVNDQQRTGEEKKIGHFHL